MSRKQLLIKNVLSQEAYFILNKAMVRNYGIAIAATLAALCEKFTYHLNKETLYDKEWFYHTREALGQELGLSDHEQRKCIQKLQELQILEVRRIGLPSKNYYRIDSDQLLKVLSKLK